MAGQLGEQDGQLPAEGDRHGGLGMRAAWHHGRPVCLGLGRELLAECVRERVDSIERTPSEEREAGIHDVLRGGSPVDEAGGVGGAFADLLEQGQDRVADGERPRAQVHEVDVLRHRDRLDDDSRLRRDDSQFGLRRRERPLHLEPRVDQRLLREELRDDFVAEPVDKRQEHAVTARRDGRR